MIFETMRIMMMNSLRRENKTLLDSMAEGGVGNIVNVSATYDSCERVVDMVQKYPFMYAAVRNSPRRSWQS